MYVGVCASSPQPPHTKQVKLRNIDVSSHLFSCLQPPPLPQPPNIPETHTHDSALSPQNPLVAPTACSSKTTCFILAFKEGCKLSSHCPSDEHSLLCVGCGFCCRRASVNLS